MVGRRCILNLIYVLLLAEIIFGDKHEIHFSADLTTDYIVFVKVDNSEEICVGIIVARSSVLTSGDCFLNKTYTGSVFTAGINSSSKTSRSYAITNVVMHGDDTNPSGKKNLLGLIKIKGYFRHVKPVRISTGSWEKKTSKMCLMITGKYMQEKIVPSADDDSIEPLQSDYIGTENISTLNEMHNISLLTEMNDVSVQNENQTIASSNEMQTTINQNAIIPSYLSVEQQYPVIYHIHGADFETFNNSVTPRLRDLKHHLLDVNLNIELVKAELDASCHCSIDVNISKYKLFNTVCIKKLNPMLSERPLLQIGAPLICDNQLIGIKQKEIDCYAKEDQFSKQRQETVYIFSLLKSYVTWLSQNNLIPLRKSEVSDTASPVFVFNLIYISLFTTFVSIFSLILYC